MSDTSPITKEELIAALVSASKEFCSDSDDSVRNKLNCCSNQTGT